MSHYRKKIVLLPHVLVTVALLILPYYLFDGKFFIGGDDSRLFYLYPTQWIREISFFSWFSFGSVSLHNPNQFLLPLLLLISGIQTIIPSQLVVSYFFFSLPLLLGFFAFCYLMREIMNDEFMEFHAFLGALLYILSPIILVMEMANFLYSIWLLPLLPILLFYCIRYIKTGSLRYVLFATLWGILFSVGLFSFPNSLAMFLPAGIAFVCIIAFSPWSYQYLLSFVRRSLFFLIIFILSQAFWLLPFAVPLFTSGQKSFIESFNVLSSDVYEIFRYTVVSVTHSASLVYPLLNLYHRAIAFEWNWDLKNIFLGFYDNIVPFNILFLVVFFFGILYHRQVLSRRERSLYFFSLLSLLLALFFFTVNIGSLREVFVWLGHIPGFAMFRNPQGKFALGYVFFYAMFFTVSLVVIRRRFSRIQYVVFASVLALLIIANTFPIKRLINKPVWSTKDIYATITFPSEYLSFMDDVRRLVPSTSNILSLPFGVAGYTFIKDSTSTNTYVGQSPVKIFTGRNDFAGSLSFSAEEANRFNTAIITHDQKGLNDFLQKYNINYVFVTKNIHPQVRQSYLFGNPSSAHQDDLFLQSITAEKIATSSEGNYELYTTKHPNILLNANQLSFKKRNAVEYTLFLKNVATPTQLSFLDSSYKDWRLYPTPIPPSSWCVPQSTVAVKNLPIENYHALAKQGGTTVPFMSFLPYERIQDRTSTTLFDEDFEHGEGYTEQTAILSKKAQRWSAEFSASPSVRGRVFYDKTVAASGKKSLRIEKWNSYPGNFIIAQNAISDFIQTTGIPVKPFSTYRISLRYKTKGITAINEKGGAVGTVVFYTPSGTVSSTRSNVLASTLSPTAFITGTHSWADVVHEIKTDANDAWMQLRLSLDSEQGILWIDDIRIEEIAVLGAFSENFEMHRLTVEQALKQVAPSTVTACQQEENRFMNLRDVSYLWRQSFFDTTHALVNEYGNAWVIDPAVIRSQFPRDAYRENADGTLDVALTLYFRPQVYFYIGVFISFFIFFGLLIYEIFFHLRKRTLSQ